VQEIEIVRIGPGDWEEMCEVRLAALLDSPAAFGSTHAGWVDASEEQWRARLSDVPLTLVARRAGRPVGLVCGSRVGTDAVELISMWVAPEVRGSGLARALIDAVVAWAGAQGRTTFLMVRVGNDRARAAYERAGFVDTGIPDDHPAGVPPEHRMVHGVDRGGTAS
jgi:ribosomal protein S18 acetylase RimI-like enzyme